MLHHGVAGIPRHVQDTHSGPAGGDPVGELLAGESRHHDVREEQVNRASVALEHAHGIGGVGGREHDIPLCLQRPAAEQEHRRFILDDEHGLGSTLRSVSRGSRRRLLRGLDAWQIDLETRAAPWLRVDGDVAVALLHNAVHRRQTETGPFAHFLRCKEWLEEMGAHRGVHARAAVGHGHHRVGPGDGTQMCLRERLVQLHIGRLDGQLPAVGHGIARVHGKIHEHLLDLVGIREHGDQGDMLTDQPPQHAVHIRHHDVEIEDLRLQHLSPAVREQLPRERRRALGCLADLLDILALRVAGGQVAQQQLCVAENGGQQVVEVVGDAARQLAHGFHLLRLAELLLEVALIADVALGAPHAYQMPVLLEADDIIQENARPAVPRPLSGFGIGQPIARPDKAANLFSIHRLVQAVLQDRVDEPTQRLWAERTVHAVEKAFLSAPQERVEYYIPQARLCADLIKQWELVGDEATRLLERVAREVYKRGWYPQATTLYLRALGASSDSRGSDDPHTIDLLRELGRVLMERGVYAMAAEQYAQARADYERVLGTDHPAVVDCLNNLALAQLRGKFIDSAAQICEQALEWHKRVTAPVYAAEKAMTYYIAAEIATRLGPAGAILAEAYYQDALDIGNQIWGGESAEISDIISGLGRLYAWYHKLEQAEPLLRRALDIRQRVLGHDHPHQTLPLEILKAVVDFAGAPCQHNSPQNRLPETQARADLLS